MAPTAPEERTQGRQPATPEPETALVVGTAIKRPTSTKIEASDSEEVKKAKADLTMYQVPITVWNEIAASQPLSQPWAELFRSNQDKLPQEVDRLIYKPLEAQGVDDQVISAYRLVAPLLIENEAISSYLEETRQPGLRTALPELVSISEAVILASQEYPLMRSQQAKLTHLLRQAMRSSPDETPSAPQTA